MSITFRGFIALPLPDPALDALLEAQRKLRADAERRGLELRWTRREQLHVTLVFLGNVLGEHEAFLGAIVRGAAREGAFDRELREVGVFGSPARARVLHVPVPDPDGALLRLYEGVAQAVEPLGVEREVRPYRPHVTLGRFRTPRDARPLLHAAALPPIPVRFDRIRLYASQTGGDGSHHIVLAEALLGA